MHRKQILLLVFPVALWKLFTHSFLEFQYWQGVEMVRWSRRQWKGWWSPSVTAHRRLCLRHRLTAVCTNLTLGWGILRSLCLSVGGGSGLQHCIYNFPPCVVILSVAMEFINLTVMQRQVATVLKALAETPIVVPAGAVFFVVHCVCGVMRELSNRADRRKEGFDGGGRRKCLEMRHHTVSVFFRAVRHSSLVLRTFHGGFLAIKSSLCTGFKILYKRREKDEDFFRWGFICHDQSYKTVWLPPPLM